MVCAGNEKMIANFCASLGLSECAWVKVQHHALTRLRLANRYAVQSRDGASPNWPPAGLWWVCLVRETPFESEKFAT
jgi:hypothetical protein